MIKLTNQSLLSAKKLKTDAFLRIDTLQLKIVPFALMKVNLIMLQMR